MVPYVNATLYVFVRVYCVNVWVGKGRSYVFVRARARNDLYVYTHSTDVRIVQKLTISSLWTINYILVMYFFSTRVSYANH